MYRGGITEEKKAGRRVELARWLKEGLLRLGPTFIKIGQQFSTRSDILAPEYIAELSELQVRRSHADLTEAGSELQVGEQRVTVQTSLKRALSCR